MSLLSVILKKKKEDAILGVPKQTDSLILRSDTPLLDALLDGQMMNTGTSDSAGFYVFLIQGCYFN